MNGTELQALRRLLFFTRQEAALLVAASPERPRGVSDRAWRMWEVGELPVPGDVAETVRALAAYRNNALEAVMEAIAHAEGSLGPGGEVVLIWYATLDDWLTLPDREPVLWRPQCSVVAEVAGQGKARLIPFDHPAYESWRKNNGNPDSETTRAAWVAEVA